MMARIRRALDAVGFNPVIVPALGLVVLLLLIGSARSENFLSGNNIANVLIQITPLLLVALGQMFVVSSGGLDLAVGGTTSLVTVVIAVTAGDLGLPLALLLGLGAGLTVGLVNGLAVSWGLDAFLTTLATLSLSQGVALLILATPGGSVPRSFGDVASFFGGPGGVIPVALPIVLIVAVAAGLILNRTRLGLHILAVGSNRATAALAGVRERPALLGAYLLSAFACVLAGIFLTARTLGGDPAGGASLTLDSLAVVVLGGTMLAGGRATVLGTVIAALAIGLLSNVLNLLQFPSYWQTPAKGVVVILAVALPSLAVMWAAHRRRRALTAEFARESAPAPATPPTGRPPAPDPT